MKKTTISISNYKDTGLQENATDLGFGPDDDVFEYGEYLNGWIEVDENLNIIGGKITPFGKIVRPETHRVSFSIGDWSGDGHSEHEVLYCISNHSVEDIHNAYKEMCKLTGLQFHSFQHGRSNYTEIEGLTWEDYSNHTICTDYMDYEPQLEHLKVLEEAGVNLPEVGGGYRNDPEAFISLIWAFIRVKLSDLTLDIQEPKAIRAVNYKALNGEEGLLRDNFGYGIYE